MARSREKFKQNAFCHLSRLGDVDDRDRQTKSRVGNEENDTTRTYMWLLSCVLSLSFKDWVYYLARNPFKAEKKWKLEPWREGRGR